MIDREKEKKNTKIAIPLIALAALVISGIGYFTGISVVYAIGMVALVIVFAAAAFSSWKEFRNRRRSMEGAGGTRGREYGSADLRETADRRR